MEMKSFNKIVRHPFDKENRSVSENGASFWRDLQEEGAIFVSELGSVCGGGAFTSYFIKNIWLSCYKFSLF